MPGRRVGVQAARRIALAAQGFGRPQPATVAARHLQGVIDQIAQFQIDSINVAVRAQYMPLFARLGHYDTRLLDAASGHAPRRLFEYWGHAACLIDVNLYPALALRRRRNAEPRPGSATAALLAAQPDLAQHVLDDLRADGPLTARDIEEEEERERAHWGWNWSQAKHVLEHHFDAGRVAVASRNSQFERLYDLPERVLPPRVLAAGDCDDQAAYEALVVRAAQALGVFDLGAVSSYFYLLQAPVRAVLGRLEAAGQVEPVQVEGVDRPCWLWVEAKRPRALDVDALVSPFDSMVYDRRRVLELFGVHYRIEVYTPAAKRQYGYYSYLYLCGTDIAARVDLKADRAAGVLIVRSAWLEEGQAAAHVAPRLAVRLEAMAQWLGLQVVRVENMGDLASALGAALR